MTERLLFYNASNGAGAIGELGEKSFDTLTSHEPGSFATGWTHVVEFPGNDRRFLFYDRSSGKGALGGLKTESFGSGVFGEVFRTDQSFPEGAFSSWSHITGIFRGGKSTALFYNNQNGSAALGFAPTTKAFPTGSFRLGWTQIVFGRRTQRPFFYSALDGAACIGFDPTVKFFEPGKFGAWTHIAVGPTFRGGDALLFYQAGKNPPRGAVGVLEGNNFQTIWGPESFSRWTHVVGSDTGWLFYHSPTGAAAIGSLDDAGNFTTRLQFPASAFSLGWTHIVHTGSAT
ncbi:hypothetical protein ACWGE1_06960 [Streptomyces sp. NPDC054932]